VCVDPTSIMSGKESKEGRKESTLPPDDELLADQAFLEHFKQRAEEFTEKGGVMDEDGMEELINRFENDMLSIPNRKKFMTSGDMTDVQPDFNQIFDRLLLGMREQYKRNFGPIPHEFAPIPTDSPPTALNPTNVHKVCPEKTQ